VFTLIWALNAKSVGVDLSAKAAVQALQLY
jgi:hypothetical protein